MRYVFGSIITLLLFTGCAKSTDHLEQQMHHTEEQIKFSTVSHETNINQQPANKAKEITASLKEITEVYAVNSNDKLLLAFDVGQIHRFQLETIEEKVKKRLKKDIPNMTIEVSTDAKIRLELKKFETELQEKNIPKKSVEKRIKQIISLSKEQT